MAGDSETTLDVVVVVDDAEEAAGGGGGGGGGGSPAAVVSRSESSGFDLTCMAPSFLAALKIEFQRPYFAKLAAFVRAERAKYVGSVSHVVARSCALCLGCACFVLAYCIRCVVFDFRCI